jgi:hypothetical protein
LEQNKNKTLTIADKNKNKIFYEGCKNNAPLTPNHECGQQASFHSNFPIKSTFF